MPVKEKEASQKEVILLAKMKHANIVTFYAALRGLLLTFLFYL